MAIAVYLFYLFYFSVNVPLNDDYNNVLNFLNNFNDTDKLSEKLRALFSYWNEHLTVFNRLIYLGALAVFGYIDFFHLIIIGNLALLVLACEYVRCIPKSPQCFLFIWSILLLVFQPQAWESMTWAMAALSNYYVLLFGWLSILFLCRKTLFGFIWAIAWAICALLTQGNGLTLFGIIIIWYLLDRKLILQSAPVFKLLMVAFLAVSIGVSVFYICQLFHTYNQLQDLTFQQSVYHLVKISGLEYSLKHPFLLMLHFLSILGAPLALENSAAAKYIGGFVFILALYSTRKKIKNEQPVIFYFMLFLLLSIFMASLLRTQISVAQALASRYRVYSVNMYVMLAILFCTPILKKEVRSWSLRIFTCFCMVFSLSSYTISTSFLVDRKLHAIEGMVYWCNTKNASKLIYPKESISVAEKILIKAVDSGIYQPKLQ